MNKLLDIIKNSTFWLCVASIIIIDSIWLYIVAGDVINYKRGFINSFLIPKVYTTNILGFLLPFLPFCMLFSKRIKLEVYHLKSCLCMALSASTMFLFAYVLELLIYYIIDPSIKKIAFPPTGLFASVLMTEPLAYICLYIIHICVWGFVLTLFGLAVFKQTGNQFYAVIAAFLASRLSIYIPIVFGNIKISIFGYIIPQLPFEISQIEDSWFANLIQIGFVFIISITLLNAKKKKLMQDEI